MPFHRFIIVIVVVVSADLLLLCPMALAREPAYLPGELLVKFKRPSLSAASSNLQHAVRIRASHALGRSRIHRLTLEPGITVSQAMDIYANDPEVEFAEPNYILRAQNLPDDTHFNSQWGLHNTAQTVNGYLGIAGADMDSVRAWDISTGRSDVVVAVVDTGCDYLHPDLAANIWTNPVEASGITGVDDDSNGLVDDIQGWDFADDDNDPTDASGHGTHVAGIIGAEGNNGRGVAGTVWQVRIMPLRFMDAFEQGTTADAIAAIEYAVGQGAKIINCSWGATDYSRALEDVITHADALFVCAAGNESLDTDETSFYPAGFNASNVLSVAASDPLDNLAWFSNYGAASVNVAAPGIRIYGLQNGRQTLWEENFDDGEMTGWTTGGVGDTWAVADPPTTQNKPALAVSPDGNYANNADSWARMPVLDMSQASAALLTFMVIGRSETEADRLQIEVSTDLYNWHPLSYKPGPAFAGNGISGAIPYWMPVHADLGPWDGRDAVHVRLRFISNPTGSEIGFYIDDITVSIAGVDDRYQYMQGTSMAAGFVSGLAALVHSRDLFLSPPKLKTIIENSVDLTQALLGQTTTGGRVDAFNALSLLSELSLTANTASADRIQLQWITPTALHSQIIIQRRTDNYSDFETVGRVTAGATRFEDANLAPNCTYFYRVQAETEDGRRGYSNQTLATTLGQNDPSRVEGNGGDGGGGGCFLDTVWH